MPRDWDREWLVGKGFAVTASKAVLTDDRKITTSRWRLHEKWRDKSRQRRQEGQPGVEPALG
jgi:hypothetical protein